MYLIAGLGNPGLKYHLTRHNFGFFVIDKLSDFFKISSYKSCDNYITARTVYNEKEIVLLKPLTYMNSSGTALKEFLDCNAVDFNNMLIIYDDVNLNFGTLRLRPGGSDGGHNGMHSVIYELGTEDIPRLRLGIRLEEKFSELSGDITETGNNIYDDLAGYVLSDFSDEETKHIDLITAAARDAVITFVSEGIKAAMNRFNKDFLLNNNP
jgi:PTH1 family peptidyl-tRNA hydrolase